MSTELELAPPIEVVETTDDDLDIPEMVAHLYTARFDYTMCGIPHKDDPHDRLHRVERIPVGRWECGKMECPTCGAPACERCYALAMKADGQ